MDTQDLPHHRKIAQSFRVLLVAFSATACMHLESVSLTSLPQNRSALVQAKEGQLVFLGLSENSDFVDDVARTLAAQCLGGRIQGILTKFYTTTYVPWLLTKRTVEAKGYCSDSFTTERSPPQ